MAAVARWLREVGHRFGIDMKWTDAETRDFLRRAFEARQRGGELQVIPGQVAPAYAKSPEVRREMKEVGRAYNEVLQNPVGPTNDPLVELNPEDIGRVLLERGDAIKKDGQVQLPTRGHGLVKIIWKHGEASDKAPEKSLTRGDIVKLPSVMRDYEPAESKIDPGKNVDQRVWRVKRSDGEQVNYVVSRFTGTMNDMLSLFMFPGTMPFAIFRIKKP